MQKHYAELANLPLEASETLVQIQQAFQQDLETLKPILNQDLSHISHFANPTGEIQIESIERVKENLFILHYQLGWQINYSCADQTESGQQKEKLRFTLAPDGRVTFKVLKFDA